MANPIIFQVNDDTPRVQYVSAAAQTIFPYPFRIFVATDLDVFKTPAGQPGNPTADKLILNIDYTVTNVNVITGGDVILTVGAAENDIITIQRDIAFERKTDFQAGGAFTSEAVNTEYDRDVMMAQQVRSLLLDLGLTYQVTDFTGPAKEDNILPLLPAKSSGKIPVWSKNEANELIAAELEENPDASTLRSDLASQSPSSPGTSLVGHYDAENVIARTTEEQFAFLNQQISSLVIASFTTGDVKVNINASQISGWVRLNGDTIGNAVSGATERANADTEDLFVLLWDNVGDVQAPVSGGRGASAIDDFNADKTIQLLSVISRVISNQFNSGRVMGEGYGTFDHTLSVGEMPSHTHGVIDPTHGHNAQQGNNAGAGAFFQSDSGGSGFQIQTENNATFVTLQNTGGGGSFNLSQPSLALAFHIKL